MVVDEVCHVLCVVLESRPVWLISLCSGEVG